MPPQQVSTTVQGPQRLPVGCHICDAPSFQHGKHRTVTLICSPSAIYPAAVRQHEHTAITAVSYSSSGGSQYCMPAVQCYCTPAQLWYREHNQYGQSHKGLPPPQPSRSYCCMSAYTTIPFAAPGPSTGDQPSASLGPINPLLLLLHPHPSAWVPAAASGAATALSAQYL